MINFNKDSVWNLKTIPNDIAEKEVGRLLIHEEQIIAAFKTVRDKILFTNKRIITADIQGITGVKRSYGFLPYSKIQFYTIETPGLIELVPDSTMNIMFSNGFTATFEFKGNVNILALSQAISQYILL